VPKAAINSLIGANVGAVTGMVAGAVSGAALGVAVSKDFSAGTSVTVRSIADGTTALIANVRALTDSKSSSSSASGADQTDKTLLLTDSEQGAAAPSSADPATMKSAAASPPVEFVDHSLDASPPASTGDPTLDLAALDAQIELVRLLQGSLFLHLIRTPSPTIPEIIPRQTLLHFLQLSTLMKRRSQVSRAVPKKGHPLTLVLSCDSATLF
jgi:hypothetical protein